MTEGTLPPVPRPLKLLTASSLIMLLLLVGINVPLVTADAPQGIISLQFATTAEQTLNILNSWGSDNSHWAVASLALDFPFVLIYVLTLMALTDYLMSDRPGIRERQAGRWVRGLFVAAGASDLGENICLLTNLAEPDDALSLAATVFAMIKFTALMIGVAGLVVIRAARRHPLSY
ncbi:hypothetical protein EZI54_16260 [Marinobacter halodurans]|uniref:Paraquat-inducible protein A n=1 Tax=Marinobacter halodurans TaxID=2528979 RepID=A0ABY1ZHB5_9GAMM|nr:hypothetical protein [Marinobacter halodurans]TBW52192.1 hypothetical protein EZI54_16260 [Marinobacter halodurans]